MGIECFLYLGHLIWSGFMFLISWRDLLARELIETLVWAHEGVLVHIVRWR
jgi:hypothetical protein